MARDSPGRDIYPGEELRMTICLSDQMDQTKRTVGMVRNMDADIVLGYKVLTDPRFLYIKITRFPD
jgi:hypothetical protein